MRPAIISWSGKRAGATRTLRRNSTVVTPNESPRSSRSDAPIAWRDAGVDDIVQSVFKTLFERICHGCYDVPDGDELWKLLLVLALNKIRSKAEYYGARKRNGHAYPAEAPANERVCLQIHARVYATVQIEFLLNETLERLPPQHRLMVKLRVEGYKVDEIARITGRSRRSAERILQETRARLLDLLREDA